MGQLLSATGTASGSYAYTYDNAGNILTANGHTYTYGNTVWKDLLTAYDGQSITYDASSNPLSYYNGTRWIFTWENGRSLASASNTGKTVSYAYDASGLRTSKTINGTTHYYYYASGKLLRETYDNIVLDFFYDQNGHPFAFSHNGTMYYYITNLQGDVVMILDANKNTVGGYAYDPYGNIIAGSTTLIANINPLRYRGYYYDTDTGFYYLQSRYYDPKVGRFINADTYASTGQSVAGFNMFAYCYNNPIWYKDVSGYYPLEAAFVLLNTWLTGTGTTQYYGAKSRIVKVLKKSELMLNLIEVAIENYKKGQSITKGTAEFTANDSMELYLATQHFSYTITVRKETRTRGILWWKHTEIRYVATVVVSDTYNFDNLRDWSGFGNVMNNIAYLYSAFGGGHDFEWYATYTVYEEWHAIC